MNGFTNEQTGPTKFKNSLAPEIEHRRNVGKVAFVATNGTYQVFPDAGIRTVKNYQLDDEEILEFETDRYLVLIRGCRLEVLVNLFLDSELFRVRVTPGEFHEKHRSGGICFVSDLEIGLAVAEGEEEKL